MLKQLLFISLILVALLPQAEAAPGPATNPCQTYYHQSVVAIAANLNAGDNEIWADNGNCLHPKTSASTVQWVGYFSGPVVIAAAATGTWTAGTFTGCTISAITQTGGSAAVASAWSAARATITMTSSECRGYVTFSFGITAVPLYTWAPVFPINIMMEQPPFDYLCDAPGITPTTYNPATTTCNDPNLLMSGTLNAILSGDLTLDGTLTIDELTIHQDPLSGEITVNCVGCNDTVSIGDTTVNVQVNATGNATGTASQPGFDGSLYVLLTAVGLFLALRSPIIGAGFLFAGSLAIFHELDRLGFTHMDNKTIEMALFVMALQWVATIALIVRGIEEKEE